MRLIRLFKQPAETLQHVVQVAGVATIGALVSITVGARNGRAGQPLTVAEHWFAQALRLDISGGVDGETYIVTVVADDVDGARHEFDIEVVVADTSYAMPDGGVAWLTIPEFVARFGIAEVIRMTDTEGAGRIGKDMLVAALTDAQSVVASHVAGRVPGGPTPHLIKMYIADLARERLYATDAPAAVENAARAARSGLEKIRAGQIQLGAGDGAAAAEVAQPVDDAVFVSSRPGNADQLGRY